MIGRVILCVLSSEKMNYYENVQILKKIDPFETNI